jgi:putative cell wall-binding protein
MNKENLKVVISTIFASLILTTAFNANPVKADVGKATRIGGNDRYQTSSQIAKQNWTTCTDVILVSGEGYADSISASVLAKNLNAPILLTNSSSLNSDTQSALNQLNPQNIYIIGGVGSISHSIEDELKLNYTVTRLGGDTRYGTNLAVANKLVDLGVNKDNLIAVPGTGFADALSIAPIAASKNQILLLINNDELLMRNTINFAKDSNVTVVGTINSINQTIYDDLQADKRIDGGSDRFSTNLNILKAYANDLKADKIYISNAAGSNGYADALVASVLAGKYAAPLVLTDANKSAATENAINYIETKATKNTDLQAIGGQSVIPDEIISEINSSLDINTDNTNNSFNLNKTTDTLTVGDTDTLTLKTNSTNTEDKEILWNSSDEKVATVDASGKITAINPGMTIITAATSDGTSTANCNITVNSAVNDNNPYNTVVIFKDSNLEKLVRDAINKPTGTLYKSDVNKITELNAGSKGISSIAGIENLTNLRELYLYGNQIDDINPLRNLINLQTLYLISNKISDITPLENLTNLQTLYLGNNQITDISALQNLINLQDLTLYSNQINNIDPLNNLINLKILMLQDNIISDISPLKDLINLQDLELGDSYEASPSNFNSGNQISDISPLSSLINLNTLCLDNNLIKDINPLKGLINLQYLGITKNQISYDDFEILKTSLTDCTISY